MLKALVVDDSVFFRRSMTNALETLDYQVADIAENGKVALNKYFKLKPDFVTLDICMPELDGKATLQELLRLDPEAKILMCSSIGSEETIQECLAMGAKAYLNLMK